MNRDTIALQDARDIIRKPSMWLQHFLSNDDHSRRCAIGAMLTAGASGDALERLRSAARALFPNVTPCVAKYGQGVGRCPIIAVNDHKDTTHDDVIAMFDKAILAEPFEVV